MTVKSKGINSGYILMISIFSIVGIYGIIKGWTQTVALLIINLLVLYCWFTDSQTFVFDEEKCVVKFLFFKKQFYWGELYTKEIRDISSTYGRYYYPYDVGVVFSTKKKIFMPKSMSTTKYHFYHPLSSIVVNFSNNSKNSGKTYEVDGTLFLQKMQEWGIELVDKR